MKSTTFGKRIAKLFTAPKVDEDFFTELEEVLIEGDVGVRAAMEILDEIQSGGRRGTIEEIRERLKALLEMKLKVCNIQLDPDNLNFVLVLGVNGVGKTTSIAKLAKYFGAQTGGDKILLSAADTFRAAAIEQLQTLGDRLGLKVINQERGADPGAVIYDSIESAVSRDTRLLFADTAGRMHNKQNLIQELQKIDRIVSAKIEPERYHKLLVIDANTGQNGLRQAEIFHDAIGVDSVMLAKYDSTSKGGIVVAISSELSIPVSFLGTGESLDDVEPFDANAFLNDLLGAS